MQGNEDRAEELETEESEDNSRDYESEARQQGWRPKDEFKGPEDKWVDAQEFVERGEQYVSLLKPRLDKLERAYQHQQQLNKDFKVHFERERKAKEREIGRLEEELKEERKRAIKLGDGDAFEEAEQKLQDLKEYREQNTQQAQQVEADPEWVGEWRSDNKWYGSDPTLTAIADNYADQLRVMDKDLVEREFLDKVSEYVKAEMPHKFEKPRKATNDVEDGGTKRGSDGGGSNTSKTGKSYKNLPNDAKQECQRLMKEGMVIDKEEYAKYYFEDE